MKLGNYEHLFSFLKASERREKYLSDRAGIQLTLNSNFSLSLMTLDNAFSSWIKRTGYVTHRNDFFFSFQFSKHFL